MKIKRKLVSDCPHHVLRYRGKNTGVVCVSCGRAWVRRRSMWRGSRLISEQFEREVMETARKIAEAME